MHKYFIWYYRLKGLYNNIKTYYHNGFELQELNYNCKQSNYFKTITFLEKQLENLIFTNRHNI